MVQTLFCTYSIAGSWHKRDDFAATTPTIILRFYGNQYNTLAYGSVAEH
jgi:hypothetical protein